MIDEAPLLILRGLTVGRAGRAVATVPDTDLTAGEAALLLGASGSGKSTALFTLAGLLAPLGGSATLGGSPLGPGLPAGDRVGMVFQDVHLLAGLSVLDNVLLPAFARGSQQDADGARDVLTQLGLSELAGRRAETLSRGEAQRVAVARTILMRPSLILADEPTASLDDANADQVADLLLEAAGRTGAALLIATHDHRLRCRIATQLDLRSVVGVVP